MGLRTLAGAVLAAALANPAAADTVRIATFDPDLTRDGPGLLLRDMGRDDAQIAGVIRVLTETRPDVLLLTGFDWDHEGLALDAFRTRLADAGLDYPNHYASRPNAGMPTDLDVNGDGRRGDRADKQGFGAFSGQGGMAILSRYQIGPVLDYSDLLWRDLRGNMMPPTSAEAAAVQRLSSVAHWDATLTIDGRALHLLSMSAGPPVFDGPDDRNGRRNHDELAFWLSHLPEAPFVLAGKLNLDPVDGDGRPDALERLMQHVSDPKPRSEGGAAAASAGVNAAQKGDPGLDTGDWPDDEPPGNLRVDYVLPSKDLRVIASGVFWPESGEALQTVLTASTHRLVWVDIDWP